MLTTKSHFRGPNARITHLLRFHNETHCGLRVGIGSRFDTADLPSGDRTFRTCEACKTAASRRSA